MDSGRKWEYKSIKEHGAAKDVLLNSFGSDGWELVSIHQEWIEGSIQVHRYAAKVVYTFKRPIDPAYV